MKIFLIPLVMLSLGFISCRQGLDEIDIYFADRTGKEVIDTDFEVRPLIQWKPVFEEGTFVYPDRVKAFYNWFVLRLVVENSSDNDFVINKVTKRSTYYGPHSVISYSEGPANEGCDITDVECQYCYPRTIHPNASTGGELVQVGGRSCYYYHDTPEYYTAVRVEFEIEFISEVYGRLYKKAVIFANRREDFSTDSFGVLLCSDGKTLTTACGGTGWEYGENPPDPRNPNCDCDQGCVCEED